MAIIKKVPDLSSLNDVLTILIKFISTVIRTSVIIYLSTQKCKKKFNSLILSPEITRVMCIYIIEMRNKKYFIIVLYLSTSYLCV